MKRGFTLIELLVVIAVISLLMAILMPVVSRAREQAKIVIANGELYGIGIALESYALDNENKYPPTRADCQFPKHTYGLPEELIDQGYLPKAGKIGRVRFTNIEDRFNKGCTYKYIAVGPKYDFFGAPFSDQYLYIPDGFLNFKKDEFVKPDSDDRYCDPAKSPVTWVLFSVGPRCNRQKVEQGNFPLRDGFPVLKYFWYSPKTGKGIITRMRLKKGNHIGTFEIK